MQKKTETKEAKRSRRQRFIIVGVVVIVIFGILSITFYQNYIAPFNRTIITVDNLQISMRYFLDRTRLAGSGPLTMLETLTNELVMKIMAPKYGIQVTDADIENELRNMASGGTGNISDVEFNEWYRQVLNDNKASDSQYREIVGVNLLSRRLQEYLAERVPTATEQVHLHVIIVQSSEKAQNVVTRLKAGEDFTTLAREVSIETASKDDGGDLGWLPPAISNYAEQITALEINEISPIIPYYNQISMPTSLTEPDAYYIFMVSEKDSSRPLTEEHRKTLQTWALDLWLVEEIPHHNITYNFNSEIYAWLNKQLEKK
jgi:parvulin-like peptidyl-prolyl isomerase